MNAISADAPASFWKTGLLLFGAVLLLSAPQAALLPLLDRDEPRFAEASREMLQSGDFIVPTFNHAPRYDKPPLVYWCQSIAFALFGQSAFTARLPSLLATAGTAFILFWWGVKLGGRTTGLIAAFGYAFCLQAIQQGRVATADALLIFFMTLTAYTGWNLLGHRAPPREHPAPRSLFRTASSLRAWTFRLVVALAAGFLAKGPEAWLPVVPLLFLAVRWESRAYFLLCFFYSLSLVAVWAIPADIASHGDYLRVGLGHHVIDRMTEGNFQGHGTSSWGAYLLFVPFYLALFWISALPWSPLLILERRRLFQAWKPDDADRYLLLNAGVVFLIFSLMVTKLPHYTLPAFPFLALFFARRWTAAGLSPQLPIRLAAGFGLVCTVVAAVLIPLAISSHASPSPVGGLVRDARHFLTPGTAFALVDFQEPNAIWEMRRVSENYGQVISPAETLSFLNQPGPRAVVLSTAAWQEMRVGANQPALVTFEERGWNTAKAWDARKGEFAFIDLTLVVKK